MYKLRSAQYISSGRGDCDEFAADKDINAAIDSGRERRGDVYHRSVLGREHRGEQLCLLFIRRDGRGAEFAERGVKAGEVDRQQIRLGSDRASR